MEIEIKKVNSFTRLNMPDPNDTIETDFNLKLMAPHICSIDVYIGKEAPDKFEKWFIDIGLNDDSIMCLKLPKEMTEKQIRAFVQPLLTLMNQSKRDLH